VALPYRRGDIKDRAREQWRGACCVTMPSFTADFSALNPAGIAHDVRLAAEHGFWGTLVVSEAGTTVDEYLRLLEIAADAAPDGFRLVAHLSFSTFDESVRAAKAAEAIGYEAALPAYDPTFTPTSAKEVVDYTRDLAERTDLALILFAVSTWGFRSFSPQGFPHEAIEEIVSLDTVAAVKYEANDPGTVAGLADVLRRVGDQALVQIPKEQFAPALVDWFGMQWMGTSNYEMYADRVPRWFAMLHDGRWDEAMELYWSHQPAREAKGAFHKGFGGANLIHRNGWKYMSWLVGYNGGLLRMPQMRLDPGQMARLRAAAVASGFEVDGSDEDFVVGRNPA
jgi:4-hydroxy-tetrahydrodipicolinate synthase